MDLIFILLAFIALLPLLGSSKNVDPTKHANVKESPKKEEDEVLDSLEIYESQFDPIELDYEADLQKDRKVPQSLMYNFSNISAKDVQLHHHLHFHHHVHQKD